MFKNIKHALSLARAAVRRRGASSQDADDWAQEAWLRMTRRLQGRVVPNPEAYLTRTAINIAVDAHRARVRVDAEAVVDELVVEDMAPGVDAQLLGKERLARTWQCLERMPARTREIFLAHRVEERTYEEIGREFGISPSVVAKHVTRASIMLSQWMEGW